jgi:glucan phosphoethanolaminetransferase (alkaline phosphatase superfamily)
MNKRKLALIAGSSYLVIFFAAIFANFFVLESIQNDPLTTIRDHHMMVRFGILAFLITAVFDVVVAWALQELFKDHALTHLSTLFRIMHAAIMSVAVFALVVALSSETSEEILGLADTFNIIWLIGLFFFGIHLILLGNILRRPRLISLFLAIAGVMYMVDTGAHFLLPNYDQYASIFLALVAIPSIGGEMALSVWLLLRGGKEK